MTRIGSSDGGYGGRWTKRTQTKPASLFRVWLSSEPNVPCLIATNPC